MNVALIGYRGSGKTSVARGLARQLGWLWHDADSQLEIAAGRSIREIFNEQGEEAFRDLESAILQQLVQGDRQVLSLGGGVVLRPQNRQILKQQIVVWLQASAETLAARIAADPTTSARRPNLTSAGGREEIDRLLAVRAPLYRECADFIVQTEGMSPEQIASEIVSLVSDRIDPDAGRKTP